MKYDISHIFVKKYNPIDSNASIRYNHITNFQKLSFLKASIGHLSVLYSYANKKVFLIGLDPIVRKIALSSLLMANKTVQLSPLSLKQLVDSVYDIILTRKYVIDSAMISKDKDSSLTKHEAYSFCYKNGFVIHDMGSFEYLNNIKRYIAYPDLIFSNTISDQIIRLQLLLHASNHVNKVKKKKPSNLHKFTSINIFLKYKYATR